MKIHRPDFSHNKACINNNGCPCCQNNSNNAIKRLTNRIRRQVAKLEIRKQVSELE